jgi:hypothetical protein
MRLPRGRFGSEAIRLRRPLIGVCVTAFLVTVALDVVAYQREANERYRSLTAPGSTCAGETESTCFPLVELRADFPAVGLQRAPLPLLGVAAGFAASLPGAITMLIVAAAFVSGDWDRGTAALILARDPDRARFVLAKHLVLLVGALALLPALWLMLVALTPLLNVLYQPQRIQADLNGAVFSLDRAARSILVIAAFAGLGTTAGILIRSSLASLGATLAFLAFGIGSGRVWPVSFGSWVAEWMRFDRDAFAGTHLWPVHDAGAGVLETAIPVAGLFASALLPLVAVRVVRRSDV